MYSDQASNNIKTQCMKKGEIVVNNNNIIIMRLKCEFWWNIGIIGQRCIRYKFAY